MKNEVAKLLRTVAWIIFILGSIAALILLVSSSIPFALICWASTFVAGAILLGLAEIIHLLHLGFSEIVPLLEELKQKRNNFPLIFKLDVAPVLIRAISAFGDGRTTNPSGSF